MTSSSTSTILFLLLFVSFYVICLSTYIYISSLSDVYIEGIEGDNKIRVKRIAANDDGSMRDDWIGKVSINKCCAEKQYLNQRYQCQDEDVPISPAKLLNKLALYIMNEQLEKASVNITRLNITNYNVILNLRDENAFTVNWSTPVLQEFYSFAQEDVSLLKLNENKQKVLTKFSTSSFCLDFLLSENVLIAYVNPCLEKLCIQKCCPHKYYYNVMKNNCTYDENMPEYIPTFYIGDTKINSELPYYLIKKKLSCDMPQLLNKLQINNLAPPMYIQEDGSLQTEDSNNKSPISFKHNAFCIDQFSDGFKENTFINGMFCPPVKQLTRDVVDPYYHNDFKTKEKKKDWTIETETDIANFLEMRGCGYRTKIISYGIFSIIYITAILIF